MTDINVIKQEAHDSVLQILETANLKSGSIFVVGCSTSEILGEKIGTGSSFDTAKEVFSEIYSILRHNGIYLAAQCCEHLNRAVIIEKSLADKLNIPIVNVRPLPKAGGSFATAAYEAFENPAAVENILCDAGMDIGGTLIGMHLKPVAVPLRIKTKKIGEAGIICARTRPKFIGGCRANYDENML